MNDNLKAQLKLLESINVWKKDHEKLVLMIGDRFQFQNGVVYVKYKNRVFAHTAAECPLCQEYSDVVSRCDNCLIAIDGPGCSSPSPFSTWSHFFGNNGLYITNKHVEVHQAMINYMEDLYQRLTKENEVENCIIIDGKKIELSEETVKEIKSKLKLDSESEVTEFLSCMDYELTDSCKKEFYPFIENGILYIKFPGSNRAWIYSIMDATKIFCAAKNTDRYPLFYKDTMRIGHMSIHL